MVFQLDHTNRFPDPELAEPEGLLAIGGDLEQERLLNAYHLGIFPWYNEGDPICWFSPHERCVIKPNEFHKSKSLAKFMKQKSLVFTVNKSFAEVIACCKTIKRKGQDGTWINEDMVRAYTGLHESGYAHSFEIWKDSILIGGMYGVKVNKVICGESMFSKIPDASKALLGWICESGMFSLIDCQVANPHLMSLGARLISRSEFMDILHNKK